MLKRKERRAITLTWERFAVGGGQTSGFDAAGPSEAPDPRVVDEWVRRLHAYSTPKRSKTAPHGYAKPPWHVARKPA